MTVPRRNFSSILLQRIEGRRRHYNALSSRRVGAVYEAMQRMQSHNAVVSDDVLHKTIRPVGVEWQRIYEMMFAMECEWLASSDRRKEKLSACMRMSFAVYSWASEVVPVSARYGQGRRKAWHVYSCEKQCAATIRWSFVRSHCIFMAIRRSKL